MDKLVWNDGLSVGIDAIDNDHKKILSLIAQIIEASYHQLTDDFLHKVFDELEYYVQDHFQREEALLQVN